MYIRIIKILPLPRSIKAEVLNISDVNMVQVIIKSFFGDLVQFVY